MANKNYLDKTGLAYFWGKLKGLLAGKQDTLVSGSNIRTINNVSLLGDGNIPIPVITVDSSLSSTSTNPVQNNVINNALANKANFTLTDTDPGEGVSLAEGDFIGVYGQTSPFPVQTSNIADSAVTTAKISSSAIKSASSATHTNYSTDSAKLPNISMLSYWNGAYDSGNASNLKYFASDARFAGGWYLAGKTTVTNAASAIVTLPTANPWGIKVFCSGEMVTGSGNFWFDLRALDNNNNAINYDAARIMVTGSTVSGWNGANEIAFAFAPVGTTYINFQAEATSVRSNSGNYRSWVWSSGNGRGYAAWQGTSGQTNNTSIKKIQAIGGNNCNIYLEVWVRDSN